MEARIKEEEEGLGGEELVGPAEMAQKSFSRSGEMGGGGGGGRGKPSAVALVCQ